MVPRRDLEIWAGRKLGPEAIMSPATAAAASAAAASSRGGDADSGNAWGKEAKKEEAKEEAKEAEGGGSTLPQFNGRFSRCDLPRSVTVKLTGDGYGGGGRASSAGAVNDIAKAMSQGEQVQGVGAAVPVPVGGEGRAGGTGGGVYTSYNRNVEFVDHRGYCNFALLRLQVGVREWMSRDMSSGRWV